jgi:hypothetical protein
MKENHPSSRLLFQTKSEEPKKDRSIGIRLQSETYDILKAKALAERRSVSNYVLLLIERDCLPPTENEDESPNVLYMDSTVPSSGVAEPPKHNLG